MAENISQEKLVGIAAAFAKAAMNNTALEDRIIDAMDAKGEDAFELLAGAMELVELKQKLGAAAPSNAGYAEAAFSVADKLAAIFSGVCSKAEIKALLPKGAADTGVAEAFAARGATNLAQICKL